MVQIIPAVLATTEEDFAKDISRIKHSSLFTDGWVHIDFMDNIFVPNKSIEASQTSKYPINLHKEAHLMVVHPLQWIDDLVQAGVKRIIFHVESEDDGKECIEAIKAKELEAGVAISPSTSIEKLKLLADKIDAVTIMGVVPGFQGQQFIPQTLNRIKELVRLRFTGNYNFKIGVDGSVKDVNIREIVEAGADFVIVGSYLLKGDIDENLEMLWEVMSGT